ncbi:DUF2572 family protein [Bisgaard Taxon 46]
MIKYPFLLRQRGIATLSILLILSSVLFALMLFESELLGLYASKTGQRLHYVKQHLQLQQLSRAQARASCENLPSEQDGNVYHLRFRTEAKENTITHYTWCHRLALFHTLPKRGVNQSDLSKFIHTNHIADFVALFSEKPGQILVEKAPHFYWFSKQQTEWHLTGNFNGVIIAEGDLHITGKGKITGAIITAGKLTLDDEINVSYKKASVAYWGQKLSRWQLAEKSWNDFDF